MHKPVSQEVNRLNLTALATLLKGCECFPFFGTLLGLTRDGDIIPHDDDVDLYANIEDRPEILRRLGASDFTFDLESEVNSSPWFLQVKSTLADTVSFVDFYFYQRETSANVIVERWNFSGKWEVEDNHIHLPYDIIYPLRETEFFGVPIMMPARPEECCEYLYGAHWRRPLMKRLGYKTTIRDHVPVIEVSANQFAEVIQQFYVMDETVLSLQSQLGDAERRLAAIESTIWWQVRAIPLALAGKFFGLFRS